jgi:phosphopantothenoylcysteine decarboxylase / phosphopantothenate---cysteine ligase
MHPSRAIRGRRSRLLAGRRIVVGVSGSIAAVEVPRILRELIRHGAEVVTVMSPDAAKIITPATLEFASGHPPITTLTGAVEHVSLLGRGEDRADLLLLAPATANTIGKIAHGIDDTPVTSCASVALGGKVPILLAPAMHADMVENPAIRESLDRLRGWGVGIVPSPVAEGEAKLASPEEVAAAVLHRLARTPWSGRRVLVIGGASREAIDEVRSVTNESSGATAVALAVQAHYRGAEVTLWLGNAEVAPPGFLPARRWRGTRELLELLRAPGALPAGLDSVWVPAALADYTPVAAPGKISSRDREQLTIVLDRAPKLLPALRAALPSSAQLVGFKLEAGRPEAELLARAKELREEARLDWVVANDRTAVGADAARVLLLGRDGATTEIEGTKSEIAARLLDIVGRDLGPEPLEHRAASRSGRRPGRARPAPAPRPSSPAPHDARGRRPLRSRRPDG